ncbi:MAG: hypothetical protein ACFE9L_13150 [Candidatus Hodarchaeota archaeon]
MVFTAELTSFSMKEHLRESIIVINGIRGLSIVHRLIIFEEKWKLRFLRETFSSGRVKERQSSRMDEILSVSVC